MLSKIISTKNASHYDWGKNCDGWHLLKDDELSVIEEKMPPNTSEERHYHKNAQQLFYILKGIATMVLKNDTITINAGESLHVPKEVAHQMMNKSDEELRFLVISSPKSHGDKVIL